MGFNVTMDKNQYNLKHFHTIVRSLPIEFTLSDVMALTGNNEETTLRTLRKMRKLRMIGTRNLHKNGTETSYFIMELYRMHYKKGEYAKDYQPRQIGRNKENITEMNNEFPTSKEEAL